ncbi:hypothetical protein RF11_10552 [Thelohanellus kitauei]|uniref:Uncharacterized protein n=1 Tax=Thelohanellus kitauei TaxID=669202 RepID=A0A0C2MEK3_THEKT|nr:hypothetical protein RF11_10552 [Thelohanellus kitauei]
MGQSFSRRVSRYYNMKATEHLQNETPSYETATKYYIKAFVKISLKQKKNPSNIQNLISVIRCCEMANDHNLGFIYSVYFISIDGCDPWGYYYAGLFQHLRGYYKSALNLYFKVHTMTKHTLGKNNHEKNLDSLQLLR